MPKDKLEALIKEGQQHLNCMVRVYRKPILKGKHFVYPARLAATRVEKDCPRASCVLSEERQPTSREAAVVTSAKLVAINRRVAGLHA